MDAHVILRIDERISVGIDVGGKPLQRVQERFSS